MLRLLFCVLLCFVCGSYAQVPLPRSHAHNDYVHDSPLYDALEYGFLSYEVDVFKWRKQLKVSHIKVGLILKKTLEELYLDPLREIIQLRGGWVLTAQQPITLMIDLKGDGSASYPILHRILSSYEDILTVYQNGAAKKGPVQVLVSGNIPYSDIQGQQKRYVSIDGNIVPDHYTDQDHTLITRVSDPWRKFFKWRGNGSMPEEERKLLNRLVQEAHTHNKEIRFYSVPNKRSIWEELIKANVDWINVNNLKKFRKFCQSHEEQL